MDLRSIQLRGYNVFLSMLFITTLYICSAGNIHEVKARDIMELSFFENNLQ